MDLSIGFSASRDKK